MLNKMVNKSKTNKRTQRKKTANTVHPHIDILQTKLQKTQEEYNKLEEDENTRELTTEEISLKQKLKTTLETYEALLSDYTSPSTKAKTRSFQDRETHESRHKSEIQILELLQLFYMVRLGQLGSFQYVDYPVTEELVRAVFDVCDQMVGASIYCKIDKSSQVRQQKRDHVFSTLRKLELGAEESVLGDVSYKQIKDFMQHIWDHAFYAQHQVTTEPQQKEIQVEQSQEEEEQPTEQSTEQSTEQPQVEKKQSTEQHQNEKKQSTEQPTDEKKQPQDGKEQSTEQSQDENTKDQEEGWGEPPILDQREDAWKEKDESHQDAGWKQVSSIHEWHTVDESDMNDDWRRRDSTDKRRNNMRGRGHPTRARGRGRGSNRGHGTILSRGRGRGRGRGREDTI
ncbi:uncharacterized protein B0P05DRAFT_548938 [Gilbertella persicaria]|uniref:uncharacterized protein n=1 Tax=Gilbertella persicaria TaxID=101096 RepID=UPI00221FE678|nr:uncharacterized protein B0P05DRAFT_548938 [Gilbertella persicaria]KAI8073524.1 hypothetical protein B0P05DRAFT_548938 [Gilbertella persicaria]